jgi:amidase
MQTETMHERPLFRSATDAARAVSRKEFSSRALTEMIITRIEAVNPAVNAVVELRPEEALREAANADEATARGEDTGALHGVPVTIKDAFNVAGLHTTWGNPAFKDFVASESATVARRLKEAGAIVVGKTNVAFMLSDFGQTANELYGVTNNPWDSARTPGGSSGGAAAALSAGMTFLDYGSDLVGSIRIPASFCGVYGLKPSVGIVPLSGFQPPGPPPPPSEMTYMSAVGPLGRFPGDLRMALSVTGGPEDQAAKAYSWALSPPRHTRLEDFRVGFVLDDEQAPVSGEVAALLSNAVDALARAGATVVEGWPDGVDPARNYESFGFHVQSFFAFQESGEDSLTFSEFVDHENRRVASRVAWDRYFDDVADVFMCPVSFTPAFWVSHASLPGLPAVAAPIGRTPGGLPVGVQIVAPLYEDDTAITLAELLADVTGGYEPPPL